MTRYVTAAIPSDHLYRGIGNPPCVSNKSEHFPVSQSRDAEDYGAFSDTTLRADERNWYTLKHNSEEGGFRRESAAPASAERKKENRCSCECWPTGAVKCDNTITSNTLPNAHKKTAVDMVAEYGVYQNSSQNGHNHHTHHQPEHMGMVVNETGASSVYRTQDNHNPNSATSGDFLGKCLGGGNAPSSANSVDECWVKCCKPALFLFLLVFIVVVLALVAGLLVYYNYMTYRPRPPLLDEPCEKTFCRWGATCIPTGDGRAHCACPVDCPKDFEPVCSTGSKTYRNHCHLRREACQKRLNIRVRHLGPCEITDPCMDKKCPLGATCASSADGLTSHCICPTSCPDESNRKRPVCGSDGREYPSFCELEKAGCETELNISVKYLGKCDPCSDHQCPEPQLCMLDASRTPVCRCTEVCELELDPVCGSDGKTYANECDLRQESCRMRQEIRIIYRGKCSSGDHPCSALICGAGEHCSVDRRGVARCSCGPSCEPYYRPVCSSDGRTFDSHCELSRTACISNQPVRVAYTGVCEKTSACSDVQCAWGGSCSARGGRASCSCPTCTGALAPVCANDNNTYGNECKMRAHACNTALNLTVNYEGACETCEEKKCHKYATCESDPKTNRPTCVCSNNCSSIKAEDNLQVCGNNGLTYDSECHLKQKACKDNANITKMYSGACELCQDVKCKYGARCSAGECICPIDCSEPDRLAPEPVCANTMITYASECELQKAACEHTKEKLHVIFYGECKDKFSAVGPPTSLMTKSFEMSIVTTHSSIDETSTSLQAMTENPELHHSTLEHLACKDIHCDFDATCELGPDGFPKCSCKFDCPVDVSSDDYFPVCASDMNVYTSMCAMRQEGCQKHVDLHLRPLELCKGVNSQPCEESQIMLDTKSFKEISCGFGSSKNKCPSGGFCHHSSTTSRCCWKNMTTCETMQFGCCEDKKTPASGPNNQGCPLFCNCNKLGSISDVCDEETMQCQCKPGVGGLRCDRCEPGFWGLAKITSGHSGCIPCGCSMFGSIREDCEQMTGRCVCKTGVDGQKCTHCLNSKEILGPNGCYNENTGAVTPVSCVDMVCYFGAICVETEDRPATCQCPAASCPTDPTALSLMVCGSDGKTYQSECHLKLEACRTQLDIVIQSLGVCQILEELSGTALPSKHFSPVQFTQDDSLSSKSTRHLLTPDLRYYYNSINLKSNEVLRNKDLPDNQKPTRATIGVVGALLGDLCSEEEDCSTLPGVHCFNFACLCLPGYVPKNDRRGCSDNSTKPVPENDDTNPCHINPCKNSGTCITLNPKLYVCVCDASFTGENCENEIPVRGSGSDIEVAFFNGDSYIQLKPLKAYHKLNIDVELRLYSDNGLILYDQQNSDGSGDFVALVIIGGFVHFRYNLGDGVVDLKSPEKVPINRYFKLSAKRYHKDAILSVSEMEDVVGQSYGNLKYLDLTDDAYIGKTPTNISKVFDNIGTHFGLNGCIKQLRIIRHLVTKRLNLESVGAHSQFTKFHNIQECTNSSCPTGDCTAFEDPCISNPCSYNDETICEPITSGGYVCRCIFSGEVASSGSSCNNELSPESDFSYPSFNGYGFIEHPKLEGLEKYFRIEVWFLPKKSSGMLLYDAQSNSGRGDFLSINLVDSYIQLRFNLGSGIANLTYPNAVEKNVWHRVIATRTDRRATLQLDGMSIATTLSPAPLTELNLERPLFIGSLPDFMRAHRLSGVKNSFVGAIQRVTVNGRSLGIYREGIPPCALVPIETNLPCSTRGIAKYDGFPCGRDGNPCLAGGICLPILNEYKCVCAEGTTGRNCESRMANGSASVRLKLDGEKYYSFRPKLDKRVRTHRGIRIEMTFRTDSQSGLLFWRKKGDGIESDSFALILNDGAIELNYSDLIKQFNTTVPHFNKLSSNIRLNDGLWHTVVAKRRKRLVLLQIDNAPPLTSYSHQVSNTLKENSRFWIGGSINLPLGLQPSSYFNFQGCVSNIKINGQYIDLKNPINTQETVDFC